MTSLILSIVARRLFYPLVIVSLIFLLSGHNLPGGGFIGALTIAAAFVLLVIAESPSFVRKRLYFEPTTIMASGLLIAVFSGVLSLFSGKSLMSSLWVNIPLPLIGDFHIGTPLLFDFGVFVTVFGVIMAIILTLAEVE